MIHNQSSPTSLKYYHNQIMKLESYFLYQFAEDMTLIDLYITKDKCMSASCEDVITKMYWHLPRLEGK